MRLGAAVGVGGRVDVAPASRLGTCVSGRHPEAGHRGRPDGGFGVGAGAVGSCVGARSGQHQPESRPTFPGS